MAVHVRKCPYGKRARATTEFVKDGKPQKYCTGWIDCATDDFMEICQNCADWFRGETCDKDFEEWSKHNETN